MFQKAVLLCLVIVLPSSASADDKKRKKPLTIDRVGGVAYWRSYRAYCQVEYSGSKKDFAMRLKNHKIDTSSPKGVSAARNRLAESTLEDPITRLQRMYIMRSAFRAGYLPFRSLLTKRNMKVGNAGFVRGLTVEKRINANKFMASVGWRNRKMVISGYNSKNFTGSLDFPAVYIYGKSTRRWTDGKNVDVLLARVLSDDSLKATKPRRKPLAKPSDFPGYAVFHSPPVRKAGAEVDARVRLDAVHSSGKVHRGYIKTLHDEYRIAQLKVVIRQYPKTDAAREAKKILSELDTNLPAAKTGK